MELKAAFGSALKQFRKSKGLTQEAFAIASSRTYVSTLERGIKAPTLDKIDELARMLGIHPLTLVAGCYLQQGEVTLNQLLNRVSDELEQTELLKGEESPE